MSTPFTASLCTKRVRRRNGDDAVVRRSSKAGADDGAACPFHKNSSSSSSAVAAAARMSSIGAPIVCGRGDKKTKKGKRFKGSYGNARPKKEKKIERIKDKVEVPRSTPWPLPFKLI
ncbi:30S ribosomal protein S31 mitochondrial [Prunus yedoensis var. nudiflora]|uniref:30S ribosomal protein S31 mitochondrial n=1 Tax=Prunus yedoensis var. nudiflora TaxID=2094558 RepID=A0A314URZ1_PRUYE|nr:30S ribosomal protein S31 mitochondrial [Prunus yedoensis var. nudiflora]